MTHPTSRIAAMFALICTAGSVSAADLTSEGRQAVADIQQWASQPSIGPNGRALPLAHSWNAAAFGGAYNVELIQRGHRILPSLVDPKSFAMFVELMNSESKARQAAQRFEEDWKPLLQFARAHGLPLAMPGHNWAQTIITYENRRERGGLATFSPEQSARMLKDGESTKYIDPFGPIERWREWGTFWMGNDLMKQIQQLHPDPPLVLLLDNHEGPRLRSGKELDDSLDRFVAKFGEGPHDLAFRERVLREGYDERYRAMFDAAREAMTSDAWKNNTRFSAYNLLWDTGHIGYGNRPNFIDPNSDYARTWPHPEPYGGAASEVYDNDWEPGKQDVRLYSMQTEAMSYHSVMHRILERDPNFIFSLITWDGAGVGNTDRGSRREVGKAYRYATDGQQWDIARYHGWAQFCLWMARPRTFMEFRWSYREPTERNAFSEATWMAVVDAVDRVWADDRLKEYWRHGEVVPNREQDPWWSLSDDHPQWLRKIDRWFLLTCDANPPRDQWERSTELNVWAMALRLGEASKQRWLIYAHAPKRAEADVTVTLPGFGDVMLPHVSRSGSFFEVKQADRSVTTLIQGGPAQIEVTAPAKFVAAGKPIGFTAELTCPPDAAITGYEWRLPGGEIIAQRELAPITHTFTEPGEHIITVAARTQTGKDVIGQTVVWTGEAGDDAMLYDLSLDEPLQWRGPWKAAGDDLDRIMSYRHLPNRGSLPMPVVSGGTFVDDPERGGVLELTGDVEQAIWLQIRRATIRQREGHPSRTISMWFKADDVLKRQVLFAEGSEDGGFNIYLEAGQVHGGAWAMDGVTWPGEWLHAKVKADQWHHVTLVLDNATDRLVDGKLKLYVDGKRIGAAPGRLVPRPFGPPRVGTGALNGETRTRFYQPPVDLMGDDNDDSEASPFVGRIDDFRYANTAIDPASQ